MMDSGIERPNSQIPADNVSGFTNQQFYQALQNDVNSMQDYKAKFFQNNFSQQNEINALFTFALVRGTRNIPPQSVLS